MSVRARKKPVSASLAQSRSAGAVRRRQRSEGVRIPEHERRVLENGASVSIMPRGDVPLVAFCAVLRGGALGDPADKPGVAALTAGLLDKGAGSHDGFAFAEAVERSGGSFTAVASAEHITVSGQFLARHQERMLELLAAALIAPRLDAARLDGVRTRHIELIKAAKDSDPQELLSAYGRALLFGAHPYGRPVGGSEDSLSAITRSDIAHYARQQLGADRLALAFTGAVNTGWLRAAAADALEKWRAAAAVPLALSMPPAAKRRLLLVDAPGATQSHFWVGARGVHRRYPRRAALDLVNTIFGGRFTSHLNTELRIRSGLSYGAASSFTRGSVPAEFAIRSLVGADQTARALDLTLGTLARLKRAALSRAQLESARGYLLGQHPLSFETSADWAHALAELTAWDLTPGYIEGYASELCAVTLDDAHCAIAEAFPDPDATVIVVIGDAARIRSSLSAFGPMTEIPLAQPGFHCAAPAPVTATRQRVRGR